MCVKSEMSTVREVDVSSVPVDIQDWNKEEVQARQENLAPASIYLAQVVFKTFYETKKM